MAYLRKSDESHTHLLCFTTIVNMDQSVKPSTLQTIHVNAHNNIITSDTSPVSFEFYYLYLESSYYWTFDKAN